MLSPARNINDLAASALRANPTAIAGLSDFGGLEDKLESALDELRVAIRTRDWHLHRHAGITLYAMIRVAQQEYAGGDGGYWPHLGTRLDTELRDDRQRQRLLGDWFRQALDHFGYESDVPGQTNLGPILWHAGWAQSQLRPFVGFVAAQAEVYGERAAEPDAPHALRLGSIATHWAPPLPRTIIRLLSSNAAGIGDLWARLAQAVLAARRGEEAVRETWEPIGGISAEDMLASLRGHARPYGSNVCPPRPRLRYHSDTGEIRLWLVEGERDDWRVEGLKLRWQGESATVLPPLSPTFTITHKPSETSWEESLFTGSVPAIWFGGRSGALERGAAVCAQGLSSGMWYLVCLGAPTGFAPADRCPLALGFYEGGEGWRAWEVSVSERIDTGKDKSLELSVDGQLWRFPIARGSPPRATPSAPVACGYLPDDTRVALYPAAPTVELRSGAQVRLLRRTQVESTLVGDWTVGDGRFVLPDLSAGVYQLREARGVGRILFDFAVIPGLRSVSLSTEGNTARLTMCTDPGGHLEGATPVEGGWRVERLSAEPWLEATWRADRAGELPIRVRLPVRAVRWRLCDPNGPISGWSQEPVHVSRRDAAAAARRLRLQIEVPAPENVSINAAPVGELTETPSGYSFTVPLDAYPNADEILLTAGSETRVAAWLTDRPVLNWLRAHREGAKLSVEWKAEFLPSGVDLAVWEPTDPSGREVPLQVGAHQKERGGEWELPAPFATCTRLAVALGTRIRQGFGPTRFLPATDAADGTPVAAMVHDDDSHRSWAELAHEWTVNHRWGTGAPLSVSADLQGLGDQPPVSEVLGYLARLPAESQLRTSAVAVLERCAGAFALDHLATTDDPVSALRAWLAIGVHPLAANIPTHAKVKDTAYPLFYLVCLAALEDKKRPLAERQDAASAIYQFHKCHGLFSPLAGLPSARAAHGNIPLTVNGWTEGNEEHKHRLLLQQGADDEDQFVAQTTACDAYWLARAAPGDPFPQMSLAGGRNIARYIPTKYEIGWDDEGYWCVGRRGENYRECCSTADPVTVNPWEPDTLVKHLGLVDWLLQRSEGIAGPQIVLPNRFDEVLFSGPLGATHRRILTVPPRVEQRFNDRFKIVGTGSFSLAAYPDVPTAGKSAWRLAWLDRLPPGERATGGDWGPIHQALREALSCSGAWADLFTACIAVAEYVRRILAGGIGSAIRFSPTAPHR